MYLGQNLVGVHIVFQLQYLIIAPPWWYVNLVFTRDPGRVNTVVTPLPCSMSILVTSWLTKCLLGRGREII